MGHFPSQTLLPPISRGTKSRSSAEQSRCFSIKPPLISPAYLGSSLSNYRLPQIHPDPTLALASSLSFLSSFINLPHIEESKRICQEYASDRIPASERILKLGKGGGNNGGLKVIWVRFLDTFHKNMVSIFSLV